jgi:transcriptional regulator with XRE-family HTH domain
VAKNQGSVLLRRTHKPQRAIARKCGVSQGTVSKWMSGEVKPEYENRKTLLELYGIPLDAWDQEPESTAPEATAPPPDSQRHHGVMPLGIGN